MTSFMILAVLVGCSFVMSGVWAADYVEASPDTLMRALAEDFEEDMKALTGDQAELERVNSRKRGDPTPEDLIAKVRVWPKAQKGSPRVLCVTYTYHKKHLQASMMYHAWGKKCDGHYFFTDKPTGFKGVPKSSIIILDIDGGESYKNMWQKTRAILRYLRKMSSFSDYDYFLLSGDDTFLITENLRKMLNEAEIRHLNAIGVPMHMGYRFLNTYKTEFLSGCGYILNNMAIRLYVDLLFEESGCLPGVHAQFEDLYISECLQQIGIRPMDTRDAFGEDRFIVMSPYHMANQARNPAYTWWFRDFRDREQPRGVNIVSRDAVLFHYISKEDTAKLAKAFYNENINANALEGDDVHKLL